MNPDIEAFLELVEAGLASGKRRPMHELTPAQARIDFDNSSRVLDASSYELPEVQTLQIPTGDGARIDARLYASSSQTPQPVLLYFHGGGYVVGSLDSHETLCRSLACRTPCAVLAVAYRLAPEHKFPTAVNDAVDALLWLTQNAKVHHIDPKRIAVGGDSAGATLATVLAILARDDSRFADTKLAIQLLIYPCVSPTQDTSSHRRFGACPMLHAQTLRWFYSAYLRDAGDLTDWRFAPLLTPNLSSLPPAHIVLAEHDVLADEGRFYAQKLQQAGTSVSLKSYAGMTHDFIRMANIIPQEATQAHDDIAQALATAFRSGPRD